MNLKKTDFEIYSLLQKEKWRQHDHLELIASENYASEAVLEAIGSIAVNKYSEGYPDNRFYGGCEYIDEIEKLAIKRAKELFHAEHANVQPHSGSQANMAVYLAVLKPTDRVMGMNLQEGGHLTHGSLANFSGILYNFKPYGLDEHGYIDFDEFRKNAKLYEPKLIVCGASSYPRIIDFYKFKLIADEVGALLMADISHIAGLIVAGLHPSPFPYCDFVTTTTHKTLRGARGGIIMCKKEFASKIDRAVFPNVQGGALQNMIAGKAVCFKEAMSPEFKDYQLNVVKNAKALANELIDRGFNLVTGHTDTHMMLIDLRNKGITGKDASDMLDKVNITVNKNVIPNDTKSPFVTSGIRIGTPAVTTRGFTENEMVRIADLIDRTLKGDIKQLIKNEVVNLCNRFPIYKGVYFES